MKGDIARAMFYMDVRYAGESSSEPDLLLTDNVGSITNGSPFMGWLSALLRWHGLDPVDASERNRNDLIYERYQRNRNPFIDHPEWVDAIFLPRLAIRTATNGFTLTWSADWPTAVLEAATSGTGPWLPMPGASKQGGQMVVSLSETNMATFFRLRLQ